MDWSACSSSGGMLELRSTAGEGRGRGRRGRRGGGAGGRWRGLCILGFVVLVEVLVAVRGERLDYVDFVEERNREAELNATRFNATASAPPPNWREGGSIAEAFDKMLDKEFPDKEDPQEGRLPFVGN